jgi:hypothetical protein
MSLIKSYLSVLNEDTKKTSGVAADNTGELEGAEKAKTFVKDSGAEANTKVEKPVDGPSQEDVTSEESAPKSVKAESTNPFDVLYNKVLAQENWELEEEEEEELVPSSEPFVGGDLKDELEAPEGSEEHEEAEEEGLEAVVKHLKSAVEALEKLVSSAGSDEEEVEEESSEEAISEESAEIEELKGTEDLGDKKKQEVKGAVPVSKGAATVEKGKEVDGKPEELKGTEDLGDKKKQNVDGVKVGKPLFAQK